MKLATVEFLNLLFFFPLILILAQLPFMLIVRFSGFGWFPHTQGLVSILLVSSGGCYSDSQTFLSVKLFSLWHWILWILVSSSQNPSSVSSSQTIPSSVWVPTFCATSWKLSKVVSCANHNSQAHLNSSLLFPSFISAALLSPPALPSPTLLPFSILFSFPSLPLFLFRVFRGNYCILVRSKLPLLVLSYDKIVYI